MIIQAFCLPVNLDTGLGILSNSDFITNSLYEKQASYLLTAENMSSLLNKRMDTTTDHNVRLVVKLNSTELFYLFHPEFIDALDMLSKANKIDTVVSYNETPEICLIGPVVGVEIAQVQLQVLFDKLSGLCIGSMYIPLHLQLLLAGSFCNHIKAVSQKTGVNIYLQHPLSQTFGCFVDPYDIGTVYMSGEIEQIEVAKFYLRMLMDQKDNHLYKLSLNVDPVKIDWLLMNKRDELKKIMNDNGSFISFPTICTESEEIRVLAQCKAEAEHTVHLLNQLVCNIYEVSISFKLNDVMEEAYSFQIQRFRFLDNLYEILSQVSTATQAELTYRSEIERLYIVGTRDQVKDAACRICEFDYLTDEISWAAFSIEFPTADKEFVIGKGKGKINRVKARCDVSMRFSSYNEHNTLLRIENQYLSKAINGYLMMLEELPAEISFHIPESHHRRIIGTGGKNIQKIMKEYCVYIKFLNTEDNSSSEDGNKARDNVVVRTPMKNSHNLPKLKNALIASSITEKVDSSDKISQFSNVENRLKFVGVDLNDPELEACLLSPEFFAELKVKMEKVSSIVLHQYVKYPHGMKQNVSLAKCFEETKKVLVYVLQYEDGQINEADIAKSFIKERIEACGHTFTELKMKVRNLLCYLDFMYES